MEFLATCSFASIGDSRNFLQVLYILSFSQIGWIDYQKVSQEIDGGLKVNTDWRATDYKCCFILEILFDILFNQFVKNTKNAKDL